MKKYTTKELKAELEGVGIRATAQRIAILGFMRENPVHPTAEVVYEALRDEVGSLSLTTVYNTLKLLVEHNLVLMLTIDDTFRCFDGNVEMHVHLMCRNCKKIIENREKAKIQLEKLGFSVTNSMANFLFVKSDKISGEDLYLKLKEEGVLVRHFNSQRISEYNRITVGNDYEMQVLIEKITKILGEK